MVLLAVLLFSRCSPLLWFGLKCLLSITKVTFLSVQSFYIYNCSLLPYCSKFSQIPCLHLTSDFFYDSLPQQYWYCWYKNYFAQIMLPVGHKDLQGGTFVILVHKNVKLALFKIYSKALLLYLICLVAFI